MAGPVIELGDLVEAGGSRTGPIYGFRVTAIGSSSAQIGFSGGRTVAAEIGMGVDGLQLGQSINLIKVVGDSITFDFIHTPGGRFPFQIAQDSSGNVKVALQTVAPSVDIPVQGDTAIGISTGKNPVKVEGPVATGANSRPNPMSIGGFRLANTELQEFNPVAQGDLLGTGGGIAAWIGADHAGVQRTPNVTPAGSLIGSTDPAILFGIKDASGNLQHCPGTATGVFVQGGVGIGGAITQPIAIGGQDSASRIQVVSLTGNAGATGQQGLLIAPKTANDVAAQLAVAKASLPTAIGINALGTLSTKSVTEVMASFTATAWTGANSTAQLSATIEDVAGNALQTVAPNGTLAQASGGTDLCLFGKGNAQSTQAASILFQSANLASWGAAFGSQVLFNLIITAGTITWGTTANFEAWAKNT